MMAKIGKQVDFAEADKLLRLSFLDAKQYYQVPDELFAAFHAKQREDFDPPIVPYAEIRTVLSALCDAGATHYIYTHRDEKSLCYYLDKYGFSAFFSGKITADDGFPSKPAPNALLALCDRFALPKEACIMIGDREIDVGSGVAAGLATCLFDERGIYPQTAATYKVSALSQILTLS